jgi:hypothetical protein
MYASYLTFQAEHRVRTAAAGRHVAWTHGNTGNAPVGNMEQRFYETTLNSLTAPNTSVAIPQPPEVAQSGAARRILEGASPLGPVWQMERNSATLFMSTTAAGYPYAITSTPFTSTRVDGQRLSTPTISAASEVGTAGVPLSVWPRLTEFYEDRQEIFDLF